MASGDSLSYQWQRNELNISNNDKFQGVDSTVLMVRNAQSEDAGIYRCVVMNGAGDAAISNEAILNIGKYLLHYNVFKVNVYYQEFVSQLLLS